MSEILYEIMPSPKERNSHRFLGYLSAFFALLILAFILWAGIDGKIGTLTIVLLSFATMFFIVVSRNVLKVGKNSVAGLRATLDGIGTFLPLKGESNLKEDHVNYSDIELLDFEENLEVHRTGKRIRRINVYRIRVQRREQLQKELLVEMIDLLPEQILKFRHLPDFLEKNGLIPREKMDTSKLP